MTLTTNQPTNPANPTGGPDNAQSTTRSTGRSKRTALVVGLGIALLLAVAGAWYFLIREVAPVEVDSVEAAAARSEAASSAGGAADTSAGIDGVWSVDTSVGQFDDGCLTGVCSSTFAGFRIDEVLSGFGDKTVVGRTPGVAGQISIDGTTITGGEFVVDMTGLITDSGARTAAIRGQAIETEAFPNASFQLTSPVDLGQVPGDGEQVTVTAAGDLTVHGVTRSVEIPLTAELQGGVIVVFGQLDLALADFDIDTPSAPVVVSVDDVATLELQLFLTR